MTSQESRRFVGRWVGANGWSECVGLGATFVLLGRVVESFFSYSNKASVALQVAAAVAFGTLLEGVVVGIAQEHVLRTSLRSLKRGEWITATAVGAGLAWAIGMIPSTVMLLSDSAMRALREEPSEVMTILLAAALGLIAGPILGLAQWYALRRHVNHAGRWLWANALAWAIGMPLIFLGMDLVPWDASGLIRGSVVFAACGVAGLAVGAIHGPILASLIRSPRVHVV